MNPDAIPAELRNREQWICWVEQRRNGNLTKIPKQPDGSGANAKSSDMATWGSFEDAVATAEDREDWGIGYMFSDADPYLGIDLDGCVVTDAEELKPENWLPPLDPFDETYVEKSPSGEGIHVILRDTSIPSWWTNQIKRKDKNPGFFEELSLESDHEEVGVEAYETRRYFTFTGDTLPRLGSDTVTEQPDLYEWLTAAWLVFEDELPDPEGDTGDSDIDIDVYDVLSRASYPEGERRAHPVHGSDTGANFMVDEGGETWRCWSGDHQVTGNALHLVGMEEGIISCADWKNSELESETWAEIFEACRRRELIEDNPEVRANGGTAVATGGDSNLELPESTRWGDVEAAYIDDSTRNQVAASMAADVLTDTHNFAFVPESGAFYYREPDSGLYKRKAEPRVKTLIYDKIPRFASNKQVSSIVDQVKHQSTVPLDDFHAPEGKILTKSGVLDIAEFESITELEPTEPTPDMYFTSRLSVEFDPKAECPNWLEFLQEIGTTGDQNKALQEFIGNALQPWKVRYGKTMWIVGRTNSGKSTFAESLRRSLFDEKNVAVSLDPKKIAENKHSGAGLIDAYINIKNEVNSGKIRDSGELKALYRGEETDFERKFEDEFSARSTAKHLHTANWLPNILGHDEAFFNRVILIEFDRQFTEDEITKELDKKLAEEASGILNWALKGLKRLREQDGYTLQQSATETRRLWTFYRNSPLLWVYENCEITGNESHWVERSTAHYIYQQWAMDRDYEIQSKRSLTKLIDANIGRVQLDVQIVDGNEIDVYRGMKLEDLEEHSNQQEEPSPREKVEEQVKMYDHGEEIDPEELADMLNLNLEVVGHQLTRLRRQGDYIAPDAGDDTFRRQ